MTDPHHNHRAAAPNEAVNPRRWAIVLASCLVLAGAAHGAAKAPPPVGAAQAPPPISAAQARPPIGSSPAPAPIGSSPAPARNAGLAVLQPDGGIVVAGSSDITHGITAFEKILPIFFGLGYGYGPKTFDSAAVGLANVAPDGKPNVHFGTKGWTLTPLPPARNHDVVYPAALLRDPRGRLLLVGSRTKTYDTLITALRYSPAGVLDPTFADHGVLTTRFADDEVTQASAAILDSQGRLVVAGRNGGRKTQRGLRQPVDDWSNHLLLARYTVDGRLDTSFGNAGFVRTDLPPAPPTQRYDPRCVLDEQSCIHFYGLHLRNTEREFLIYHGAPAALAEDPQGRLVAASSASDGTVVLARFLPQGALDASFGEGGTTRTAVAGGGAITNLQWDRQGRILAVGASGEGRILILRYSSAGTLDTTYAEQGIRQTQLDDKLFRITAALIDRDDWNEGIERTERNERAERSERGERTDRKEALFVAAAGGNRLLLARYDGDGNLDPAFGSQGILSKEFPQRVTAAAGLVLDDQGGPTVAALSDDGVALLHAERAAAPTRR